MRPCTVVYLVLCLLTMLTFTVGQVGVQGLWVSLGVLGIALLKGQLVADHFMGLKGIRGPWRWVVTVWLALVGGLVGVAFALSVPGGAG